MRGGATRHRAEHEEQAGWGLLLFWNSSNGIIKLAISHNAMKQWWNAKCHVLKFQFKCRKFWRQCKVSLCLASFLTLVSIQFNIDLIHYQQCVRCTAGSATSPTSTPSSPSWASCPRVSEIIFRVFLWEIYFLAALFTAPIIQVVLLRFFQTSVAYNCYHWSIHW